MGPSAYGFDMVLNNCCLGLRAKSLFPAWQRSGRATAFFYFSLAAHIPSSQQNAHGANNSGAEEASAQGEVLAHAIREDLCGVCHPQGWPSCDWVGRRRRSGSAAPCGSSFHMKPQSSLIMSCDRPERRAQRPMSPRLQSVASP
jgi:hypothetical protein